MFMPEANPILHQLKIDPSSNSENNWQENEPETVLVPFAFLESVI